MFSHVMLGATDLEASKNFYDAVLGTLGHGSGAANKNRYFWRTPSGMFAVTLPLNGEPATVGNGSTIGFSCSSAEQAAAAHAAGVAAGGTSIEDAPGYRGEAPNHYYLAYLRDPAGNKICLIHRPAKA